MTKFKTIEVPISKLEANRGQIEGLPKNPRIIRDERFQKLVKSIQDDPEMLSLRELIVYPIEAGKYVVIAGNMRLKAMQELGYKTAPCKELPHETPLEKLKAYIIKDNVPFGDTDWEAIAEDWDTEELADWGMNVPTFASEIDYSILDEEDISETLSEMANGVKKAIQIEFEPEHYEQAFAIIKFWREQDAYVGKMIMDYLESEKRKL